MKKILLLIFFIVNIVPLFFILRFAFLFFTTTYDIFPEANQSEVETAVRRTLDLYGFKGDMKVTKFSRNKWTSEKYKIEYNYSEEVDGSRVTVSHALFYRPKSSKYNPQKSDEELAYDGTTRTMLQEFSDMAHKLLNQHPVSVSNKEKVENFFKQYENPNLEYVDSYWSVDSESENIQDYYALIEKNRKEGKAFQGLYDLPIDEFLEKGIIKGSVRYKDTVLEEGEKDYFDSEGGLTDFISNGIDNAELPDAFYEVSYYYAGKTGKSYRSGSSVPLKVQNHKMLYYGSNFD